MVEYKDEKVYITPTAGVTSVNTELVTARIKLTHGNFILGFTFDFHHLKHLYTGDIVQFGSTVVFRFNHPKEAAEMKESSAEVSITLC